MRANDAGGALSERGTVREDVLHELLLDPYFAASPPKSTGREHFGADYAARLHRRLPGEDGVRTAVMLTVESIADFLERHVPTAPEVLVSGGGTHHPLLMRELAARLARHDIVLRRFDAVFFSGDAKEAAAFAMLGWLSIHGQPGNLPAVTGAAGMRVLGSVTPA